MNPKDICRASGLSIEECQYMDICDCFRERVVNTTPELPPLQPSDLEVLKDFHFDPLGRKQQP